MYKSDLTIPPFGNAGKIQETVDFGTFPSTRYQGSKRKILPWIYEHLRKLDFHTALDLFGGSTVVSYLFKRMGKSVIYNDTLRFNYVSGLALIENDFVTLPTDDVKFLTGQCHDKHEPGFIERTFEGIYFTRAENRELDYIRRRISELAIDDTTGKFKAALASHALFQTCLVKRPFNLFHRKNLYLRSARVKRTFGNKQTWDTPLIEHFAKFLEEASSLVFKGRVPCRSMNCDALSSELPQCDLVYIDPPYLSQRNHETSDYYKCYHFLEGFCRYDEWPQMIDMSTHNRRLRRVPNIWLDNDQIFNAFDSLFEKFKESILVISYKRFGVPSISTLRRMLRRHGRRVCVHSRHYVYALNNQNGDAQFNREALIVAT